MSSTETDQHQGWKALGMEWAPINIPFQRRLQTLAVMLHFHVMILSGSFFIPIIFAVFFFYATSYRWIVIVYMLWFLYDANTPSVGSRPIQWIRNLFLWQYFRDYFPAELHKTCDLDPNKNYIFGYHPHGLIGIGAFVNFCTEATGFSKKFPGIKLRLMTLRANFWFPIVREYLMSLGLASVSRESISYMLSKEDKGYGVMIVVGGAQEALDAHPGKHAITLTPHKGFVKQAIQHGADLVPVFSFGETELFWTAENPEGSKLRKFQTFVKQITRVSPVVFHGRGIFNYTMGLMPFRKPINTVVGKPLAVKQNPKPTRDEVAALHAEYVQAVKDLFNEHKSKFTAKDAVLNVL